MIYKCWVITLNKVHVIGIVSKWNARELTGSVQLIFVATPEDNSEHGFGRFLNPIEQAMQLMAVELAIEPKEDVMVRFHQHLAYNFSFSVIEFKWLFSNQTD